MRIIKNRTNLRYIMTTKKYSRNLNGEQQARRQEKRAREMDLVGGLICV